MTCVHIILYIYTYRWGPLYADWKRIGITLGGSSHLRPTRTDREGSYKFMWFHYPNVYNENVWNTIIHIYRYRLTMCIYIYIICCPTLRRMATTAWSISWFGLQIGQRRCSAQPWRLGGLGASSGFHQIYGDSMLTWVMIKGYTPRVTSDIETIEEPKPLDLSWRFLVPVSFAYVYKYLYIYVLQNPCPSLHKSKRCPE